MAPDGQKKDRAETGSAKRVLSFYRTIGKLGSLYFTFPFFLSIAVSYFIVDGTEVDLRLRNAQYIRTSVLAFVPMQLLVLIVRTIIHRTQRPT